MLSPDDPLAVAVPVLLGYGDDFHGALHVPHADCVPQFCWQHALHLHGCQMVHLASWCIILLHGDNEVGPLVYLSPLGPGDSCCGNQRVCPSTVSEGVFSGFCVIGVHGKLHALHSGLVPQF